MNENAKNLEYDEEFDMTEDEVMFRFNEAVRIANEVSHIKKLPICEYDEETNTSYLLYPDGRKVYPNINGESNERT